MRKLLFLVIFLSGCAHQTPFEDASNAVACFDENGDKITNVFGYDADRASKWASAYYNPELKRRELRISAQVIKNTTPRVFEFIALHECGHHTLGHVKTNGDPLPMLWTDKAIQNENDADCFAAQHYYDLHGREEFFKMYQELDDDHWLGVDDRRIRKIKQCIIAP